MRNPAAKGRRLVQLAKRILEAKGCWVEIAVNAIRWIPKKGGGMMPISVHHDIFGLWDALALWPNGDRSLYQVTVLAEVSRRRQKILDSKFLVTELDAILAYQGGRGRHFRVYAGPTFEEYQEEWSCVP